MIEVEGTQVFTELDEVVDPAHTALLVIDMQGEDNGEREGWSTVIDRIGDVVKAAREAGVYVVYTFNEQLGYSTISAPYLKLLLRNGHRPGVDPVPDLAGTPKTQIIPRLAPKDGERVMAKRRGDAFAGTDLDMILRSKQIVSVVVTGGSTDWCVESTMFGTYSLDYYAVMLEDCVRSPRPDGERAAIEQMRMMADVATAEDVIAVWKRHARKKKTTAAG